MRTLTGQICLLAGLAAGLVLAAPVVRAKSLQICVDVQIKTYQIEAPSPAPPPGSPKIAPPRRTPAPPAPAPALGPRPAQGPSADSPAARQPSTAPPASARGWENPFGRSRVGGGASTEASSTRARRRAVSRPYRRAWSPYPYPPDAYLKRLVEHFVTHEDGYEAVAQGCAERIQIELYPLQRGWTAFARYSRRAQEEKVDVVQYEELPRFAERVVRALLFGKDIATTADLRTILGADSIRRYRTIKGMHFFTFAIGTAIRVGMLPTYQRDTSEVKADLRDMEPLAIALGYRGRFNAWGLDIAARGGVGLQRLSLRADAQGNHERHVDLGGLFDVTLHFLRYHRPHGMISFYYGGGAMFDLTVLESILPAGSREDRERIVGGGLNIDGVLGFEFMRASGAQFFIQLCLSLPTWVFNSQSRHSDRIRTYMPEASVAVGLML